jgi:hypothetical protein
LSAADGIVAGWMNSVNCCVATFVPLSVTLIMKEKLPDCVGVPAKTPATNVMPEGNVPDG